jgi:ribosomal protein L7/L12
MKTKPEIALLSILEKLYEKYERPNIKPVFPYDKKTGAIQLPDDIVAELKFLLLAGNKPAAVKRVAELTGAGLRVSKDYVDGLQ